MPSELNLYNEAGTLYCKVAAGVCNLKNGLFQSNFSNDLKKLLAIVAEAIKNKAIVNEIFKRSKLGKPEKENKKSTRECDDGSGCENCKIKVQIYDMLFGQATSNTSGCPLISKMRVFKTILDELMTENKVQSKEEILKLFRPEDKSIDLPVYVRINLLLITKEAAVEHFTNAGYNFLDYEDKSVKYNQYLEWAKELKEYDFMPDYHLHDQLLVFHPSAVLHTDKLVRARKALIQDKASCIPAAVLDPDTDMDVLDACAAPGNKTTHLLALLSRKSVPRNPINLFAFDRDETRFKSLEGALSPYRIPHAVCNAVTVDAQLQDFTKADPTDPRYANVGYICLDPSCSGSGIMRQVDRMAERNSNTRIDPQRLQSLHNFQAMLLSHALSFPSVKRVVYSTCSVTNEENEGVVQEIMDKFGSEFALRPIWMDCWMTRGKKIYKECIRTNPSYDLCNGFFVACFERIAESTGDVVRRKPKLDYKGSFIKKEVVKEPVAKKYRKRRKAKKTGAKAREQLLRKEEKHGESKSNEVRSESSVKNVSQIETGEGRKKDKKSKSNEVSSELVTKNVSPIETGDGKKKDKKKRKRMSNDSLDENAGSAQILKYN